MCFSQRLKLRYALIGPIILNVTSKQNDRPFHKIDSVLVQLASTKGQNFFIIVVSDNDMLLKQFLGWQTFLIHDK